MYRQIEDLFHRCIDQSLAVPARRIVATLDVQGRAIRLGPSVRLVRRGSHG